MLEQYRRLKAEHPGSILLFRMGDFYETFGEDALVASRVLGIALTSRDKKKDPLPLAGVPHHSIEGYLRKLVEHGYSVAIAEQMETAEQAKGLVERQVIEVVTPGTVTRPGLLESNENNYIIALLQESTRVGVAVAEISTGEFRVGEVAIEDLAGLIRVLTPREVLLPSGSAPSADRTGITSARGDAEAASFGAARLTRWDAARFDCRSGREALERRFRISSLDAFGLEIERAGFGAAGALLDYLRSLKKSDLPQFRELRPLCEGNPLVVDEVTLRNLEVFESPSGVDSTLLALLDRTETSMGARALRSLLRAPTSDPPILEARLDRTTSFASSASLRSEAHECLLALPWFP